MSRTRKVDEEFSDEKEFTEFEPEPLIEEVKEEKQAEKIYYKAVKWKGILDTFYCETCGYCQEDEGTMILHVIKHLPEAERETVMNKLISEMKEK